MSSLRPLEANLLGRLSVIHETHVKEVRRTMSVQMFDDDGQVTKEFAEEIGWHFREHPHGQHDAVLIFGSGHAAVSATRGTEEETLRIITDWLKG